LCYDLLSQQPIAFDLHRATEQDRTIGNQIDMDVFAGKVRHKCRLVAVRADKQTTEKRRRDRRKKAQEIGKTASSAALERDGWHLMLTNLPAERISVATLAGLYRSRWAVEIQFRAWKQSLHIAAALNRKSNKWHVEALVCGSIIVALMGLKQMAIYARQVGLAVLSPEKIMDWITTDILKRKEPEKLAADPPELRYVQRDVRTRKSTVIQGISALS
jgi:hypothetical protein